MIQRKIDKESIFCSTIFCGSVWMVLCGLWSTCLTLWVLRGQEQMNKYIAIHSSTRASIKASRRPRLPIFQMYNGHCKPEYLLMPWVQSNHSITTSHSAAQCIQWPVLFSCDLYFVQVILRDCFWGERQRHQGQEIKGVYHCTDRTRGMHKKYWLEQRPMAGDGQRAVSSIHPWGVLLHQWLLLQTPGWRSDHCPWSIDQHNWPINTAIDITENTWLFSNKLLAKKLVFLSRSKTSKTNTAVIWEISINQQCKSNQSFCRFLKYSGCKADPWQVLWVCQVTRNLRLLLWDVNNIPVCLNS